MNFSRGFQSGFRRASMNSGFFRNHANQMKGQARMQSFMNLNTVNMYKAQVSLFQT